MSDPVPSDRVGPPALSVLVVDDEEPARAELAYLLGRDPRVARVLSAGSGAQALDLLAGEPVDVVFSDIKMPGLDGLALARVLARFAEPPKIVFVTAYDVHAVDAFELQATDYLMKPVRAARLAESIRRVLAAGAPEPEADDGETIAVVLGGVTRYVKRSRVRYVEAQGDYVRLHVDDESHLLRASLATLEQRWAAAGFVRIHRSTLISLAHVQEIRTVNGRYSVRVGPDELPVSRRHARALREQLTHRGTA